LTELDPTYPQYLWYPEVLNNASSSAEHSSRRLASHIVSGGENLKGFITEELVQNGLGIKDATDAEIQNIIDNPNSYSFADMISRRAQIGWSTHGHSAVDVNIYGTAGSEKLRGNHENTEIGKFLRDYLGLSVDDITEELKEAARSSQISGMTQALWTGDLPTGEILQSLALAHGMSQGIDSEL
jgi:alkaline phosphatase